MFYELNEKMSASTYYKPQNHSRVTILLICVYALNRNKHGKLYLPSTFKPQI